MEISSFKTIIGEENFEIKSEIVFEDNILLNTEINCYTFEARDKNVEFKEPKIEHCKIKSESKDSINDNFTCKDKPKKMFEYSEKLKTENQNEEIHSVTFDADQGSEMFDNFSEYRDIEKHIDAFEIYKSLCNSSKKTQEIYMQNNIQCDDGIEKDTSRHDQPKARSKIFKCKNCSHETTSKIEIVKHIILMHNKNKIKLNHCHKCSDLSCCEPKQSIVEEPVNTNSNKSKLKVNCQFCNRKFSNKMLHDDHILKNHKDLIKEDLEGLITCEVFKCPDCNFETTLKRSLERHGNKIHYNKTNMKCQFCDKTVGDKVAIDDHLLKKHTELSETDLKDLITSTIHSCHLCSYKTTHMFDLFAHKQKHDKEKSRLKCIFCHNKFSGKTTLEDHLLKRHPELIKKDLNRLITNKIYTCNICLYYRTTYKSLLNSHIKSHNKTQIKCKFCDLPFALRVSMEDHLLKRHSSVGETDLKGLITHTVHTCTICSYKSTYKQSLNTHIDRIHKNII